MEALGLIADKLGFAGGPRDFINAANSNLGMLGYLIVAVFVASWLLSVLIYRLLGYDKIGSA